MSPPIFSVMVVIRSDVLDGILQAAASQFPREFFCLLGGRVEGDVIRVTDIVYIPFKNSERYVIFNPYSIPINSGIVGSAHSHPFPSPPSSADRGAFPQTGFGHLIVFPPFNRLSVRAYDVAGREIPLRMED